MASLASARTVSDPGVRFARPAREFALGDPDAERPVLRAVYQPSRRSGPVAVLASAGVILAVMAALATLNVVAQHKAQSRLTVVAMKKLDTTPPPPSPKSLEKPDKQPPLAFVPKPRIVLPSAGPTQVALDLPPPAAAPSVTVAPRIIAPVGTQASAAPAASSDPVEGGDLSSQVLSARPPVYPLDARRRREQGTVKLLVLVGPDGRVSDIALAASSGSDSLDRAALGAVKRWRWAPQTKSGAPVAVSGYVVIPFVLTN